MSLRSILVEGAQRVYSPARERFHEERADLFLRLVKPREGQRLLDLGGGDGSFAARIVRRVRLDVTVADPEPTREAARAHGFRVAEVEPARPLPFEADAFDVVLCNSVIEHATAWRDGPSSGDWRKDAPAAQRRFAEEIRRVGRAYFVQTPHADFPLDAHLWLPFTNWLPHGVIERLVPLTDRLWLKHCGVADWRLLRRRPMEAFFPDGRVVVERVFGLPKSLVAYTRAP